MADIVKEIEDILSSNWDSGNTSISYDPDIHTGWINTQANQPQVTVTTPEEGPIQDGTTPWSGIDPTGAGPTQEINGSVDVSVWSNREVESNVNPKKLVHEFSEEVIRLVKDNRENVADHRFIGYGGRERITDTSGETVWFRYSHDVTYHRSERP